jgi:predicted SAM-dependent methyltransferase
MTFKQKIGSLIIPLLPFTNETFVKLRFELNALFVRINTSINPFILYKIYLSRKGNDVKLNVGCGPFGEKDWINLDLFKFPCVSYRYDCRTKLPFKNKSVKSIRCEHFFEHLDNKDEAPKFLKEASRVLNENGVLRIIVPDLSLFANAYVKNDKSEWAKIGYDIENLPWGLKTPMDLLNHTFRQDGEHKFGYDFETLNIIVKNNGFKKCIQQQFQRSIDNNLINDLVNHKPYSLYVDCVK